MTAAYYRKLALARTVEEVAQVIAEGNYEDNNWWTLAQDDGCEVTEQLDSNMLTDAGMLTVVAAEMGMEARCYTEEMQAWRSTDGTTWVKDEEAEEFWG